MASTENEKKFNRYQLLCHEQVERLEKVMGSVFPVHGRNHYPTLDIKLKDLVRVVSNKLKGDGVKIRDIRINGGAASYIVSNDDVHSYNDLDLIFGVDLVSSNDLQKIKNAALDSLLDFLPKGVNKDKMSRPALASAYVQKLVKVTQSKDRWSLISLSNNKGRNIELKFVDTMKRQFEFSVDSFQVILDSLLTFYTISETSSTPMSQHFYPTVVAESVYGNFSEALDHLHNKLIATRNPEEIRGGGLLKYCNLQVRGYTHAKNVDCKALERYMCSRFFIDFTDIRTQQSKLENYLANHFAGDDQLKYDYLVLLYNVVNASTICLMNHERQQTLNLIQELANQACVNLSPPIPGPLPENRTMNEGTEFAPS
ncbi:unnamed protein product [Owenia fusiformis]|uniref:polynucleotide adenylyltransferase n=1 Tax=Owenia fusiformis TaxID=6347 RepID=A0A8S4PVR0_OWEFU|nr:unnamed protein product [Owenia fusiformis]